MEIKAKAKHIKMSPRKVRLVADVIRGLEVGKALDQLNVFNKKATSPLIKLVDSAIANAVNNFELNKDNLFIKEVTVNEGPTLKRWMPRARGRATTIRKRTSHVDMVLGELVDSGKVEARKQKIDAPMKLDSKPEESDKIEKVKKTTSSESKEKKAKESIDNKKIIDPRGQGKGKHTRIEGTNQSGLVNKIFRRKSG